MYSQLANPEWLRNEYIDKLRTLQSIAEEVGCCKTQLCRAMERHGIDRRRRTSKYLLINNKDWLRKAYIDDGRSMNNIAKEVGCKVGVLHDAFKAMGINTRSDKEAYALQYKDIPNLGDKTSNWKGGRRVTDKGYIYLFAPDHPFADKRGTVFEHRLVMEHLLGRYLNPSEVVHHVDGNKQNNDPSNLLVMDRVLHRMTHKQIFIRMAYLENKLRQYERKYGPIEETD
jgi:hypothetical protein